LQGVGDGSQEISACALPLDIPHHMARPSPIRHKREHRLTVNILHQNLLFCLWLLFWRFRGSFAADFSYFKNNFAFDYLFIFFL
jgi:hypothetical protein